MTLAYLEWAIARGVLVPGDVLLLDNEQSWKTEWVETLCEAHNIQRLFFPTGLGSYMNPCDNSFHAAMKSTFHKLLTDFHSINIQQKITLAKEAYYSLSEQNIQQLFKHCGIINTPAKTAVRYLLSEGCHPSASHIEQHQRQLDAYIKWQHTYNYTEDEDPPSRISKSAVTHKWMCE